MTIWSLTFLNTKIIRNIILVIFSGRMKLTNYAAYNYMLHDKQKYRKIHETSSPLKLVLKNIVVVSKIRGTIKIIMQLLAAMLSGLIFIINK